MKKILACLFVAGILFFCTFEFGTKKICVFAEVDNKIKTVAIIDARKNLPLTIKFIHSVQKTPVIEELEFDGEEFVLRRTIYKSHGVGLPFMESDGDFREEDGNFIMDNMNRKIKNLQLRTGLGTKLCIVLDGKEFKLHEMFKVGTKIIVDCSR